MIKTALVVLGGLRYEITITPAEEGGYRADCPELPGCMSQGETIEETIEKMNDAIEGHLKRRGFD